MRSVRRDMHAARGARDPASYAAARARFCVVHARAVGRDPRIDPIEADVVRATVERPATELRSERVDVTVRVVSSVLTDPTWVELQRVPRRLVLGALEAQGWRGQPHMNGLFYVPSPGERGVFVHEQRHGNYGLTVGHAVERLAELRGVTEAAVAAELGVVGPWIDWRAVLDLDAFGYARTLRDGGRAWSRAWSRAHRGKRAGGRCTLAAWRAWANGGEVLRFAEECG